MVDDDEGANQLIEVTKDFGETYAEVQAWAVPPSDRYPDGIKYSYVFSPIELPPEGLRLLKIAPNIAFISQSEARELSEPTDVARFD